MKILEQLKPASSRRTRLFLASLIWTGGGSALVFVGLRWLAPSDPWSAWVGLATALAVGWIKSRFVLTPRAAVNADRIAGSGQGRCLGGAFSWASWVLVLLMIGFGRVLRNSAIPDFWLGLIYVAVGSALVFASGVSWRRWRRIGPAEPGRGVDSGPA